MKTINMTFHDFSGNVDIVRHASRGIVINKGKILLGYERKIDQYIIPGGGVEGDESFGKCCEREILEETGIIVKARNEFLEISEFFGNVNHINHYFACEFVSINGKRNLTEEEQEVDLTFVWVSLQEAVYIFGQFEKFKERDVLRFGLYKREYSALKLYDSILNNELSAMAVVLCCNKLLTTNENIYGNNTLSLPKGHNEEGESVLETAIRECYEETNILLTKENFVKELPSFFYEFFTPSNNIVRKTIVPLLFNVTDYGNPIPKEKRMISVQWMDISYFLENCSHENVKDVILQII